MKAKNLRWRRNSAPARSAGRSSPAGSSGSAPTTQTARREAQEDFAVLACFREADGKFLWPLPLAPARERPDTGLPAVSLNGSPLAEGDRLWFCHQPPRGRLPRRRPAEGRGTGEPREVWKLDLVKELKVTPRPLMFTAAPTSSARRPRTRTILYVPTGNGIRSRRTVPVPRSPGLLVCLRKDTGKVVWSDNSPGKNMLYGHSASPLVVEVGGRAQVIHPQADGWVRSFDAETGKLVWKFDCNPVGATGDRGLGGGRREAGLRPRDAGLCRWAGVLRAPGLTPRRTDRTPADCSASIRRRPATSAPRWTTAPGKGKKNPNSAVVWEYTRDDPKDGFHFMLVVGRRVHDGLVYAVDQFGIVHCLDAKTGERHWWHDTKGGVFGYLLVADAKVYVGTGEGEVWIFGAGKMKQLVGRHDVDRPVIAPPVFANGVLSPPDPRSLTRGCGEAGGTRWGRAPGQGTRTACRALIASRRTTI